MSEANVQLRWSFEERAVTRWASTTTAHVCPIHDVPLLHLGPDEARDGELETVMYGCPLRECDYLRRGSARLEFVR